MKKIFAALATVNALGSEETIHPAAQAMLARLYSVKSQKGVTMIEYALIAALVSIAVLATLQLLGPQLDATFQAVLDALTAANG